MTTPQLAVIELVVSDMASALAFYRALGLDVPADRDDSTAPAIRAATPPGIAGAFAPSEGPETVARGRAGAVSAGRDSISAA